MRAFALVLLVCLGGCYPGAANPNSQTIDECYPGGGCVTAGEKLERLGALEDAKLVYGRGCIYGNLLACEHAIRLGHQASLWQACELGVVIRCFDAIASVPPTDSRRPRALEKIRTTSLADYVALVSQLTFVKPAPERLILYACQTEPVDVESCGRVAMLGWDDRDFGKKIRQVACDVGSASACLLWGENQLQADRPAARASIRRGCELGNTSACEVEQRLVREDHERATRPERCRQGDKEACRLLGEDAARRESKTN